MGCANCMGGIVKCAFGMAPSSLTVLPINMVMSATGPIANIIDNKPLMNLLPFGMCMTPSNPMVAAATAAALGVLVPMPCIPIVSAPWVPGSVKVIVKVMPALDQKSMAICNWGGVITTIFPGQVKIMVP